MKKILRSIQFIVIILGQKQCHPNEDEYGREVTKKRVGYIGDTKESKKYGCVCTCCHANDLPQYKCVIFLRNNYNFDIPAAANALSQRHGEIRQKEFICKPCHKQLKDCKYSNNFQNCLNSDMFGSSVNHEQDDQDNVHGSRTHNDNNMLVRCMYIEHGRSCVPFKQSSVKLLIKSLYNIN